MANITRGDDVISLILHHTFSGRVPFFPGHDHDVEDGIFEGRAQRRLSVKAATRWFVEGDDIGLPAQRADGTSVDLLFRGSRPDMVEAGVLDHLMRLETCTAGTDEMIEVTGIAVDDDQPGPLPPSEAHETTGAGISLFR